MASQSWGNTAPVIVCRWLGGHDTVMQDVSWLSSACDGVIIPRLLFVRQKHMESLYTVPPLPVS
jgi:hypothetical protein